MPRGNARCRSRLTVILMYAICVVCLEYMVTMYRTLSNPVLTDQTLLLLDRNVVYNEVHVEPRNMSREQVASYMLGLNESRPGNTTNVTVDAWDSTQLHMLQMRLGDCIQKNRNMMKCLEEEYVKERVKYLEELKANRIAESKGKTPEVVPLPDVLHRRARAPGRPPINPPTDNPELVAQYYKRGKNRTYIYQYDTLVTPKQDCDNDTFMVVLVHSFHPYDDRRRAIRDTWGGVAKGHHPWPQRPIKQKLKFMFVLGQHTQQHFNEKILNESKTYDDMIIGNFTDAYVNMTLKSLLGLKYVSEHCQNVKYLLKTDDDMIVNLPYMLDILSNKTLNRSIMGPLNVGSKVYRSGKWKVRREDYPFVYYPPYESGAAYVITNDLVRDLYVTAEYMPQIHVDDVYITGILGKLLGVKHVVQPGFAFWTNRPPSTCDIIKDVKITGTKMTPSKLQNMWSEIVAGVKC